MQFFMQLPAMMRIVAFVTMATIIDFLAFFIKFNMISALFLDICLVLIWCFSFCRSQPVSSKTSEIVSLILSVSFWLCGDFSIGFVNFYIKGSLISGGFTIWLQMKMPQSKKDRGCLGLIFNIEMPFLAVWAALKKAAQKTSNYELWALKSCIR